MSVPRNSHPSRPMTLPTLAQIAGTQKSMYVVAVGKKLTSSKQSPGRARQENLKDALVTQMVEVMESQSVSATAASGPTLEVQRKLALCMLMHVKGNKDLTVGQTP